MLDLYYSDDLSVMMSQINGNLTVCSTAQATKQEHVKLRITGLCQESSGDKRILPL